MYYFRTSIDIGSSGVESFSFVELRSILAISQEELDHVVFCDSTTLGAEHLRASIARRWGNGDADRVIVVHGSSEGIFLVMNTLLEPGDEVVALEPVYHSLVSIASTIGCRLRRWRLDAAAGFQPDMDEARRLITPRTRMVVVNFPHNPTGVTLTREQQDVLISAVADAGAYLVWDAAFNELTYDGHVLPDPTLRYERAISIGTLSKAYGLPGLRFGWCLAAPDVITSLLPLRDRSTLHLSPLVELIAHHVVERAELLLDIRRQQAARNLDLLADWADRHVEHVEWHRPAGGVTTFPRFRNLTDVEPLCHRLARDHGVLLVPGACFGHPDRARLGFGCGTSECEEGLSRLSALLRRAPAEVGPN